MVGIYKITNRVNNKVYIGQSKNIEQRWKAHRTRYWSGKYAIQKAMIKYGIDNFDFTVLEECEIDELNNKEIYWISYYDSHNSDKGYNLTDGGDSPTKTILNEQQVLEIYELLKTQIPMEDIASKYNISYHTISDINTGTTWVHKDIQYPIRDRYDLLTCKIKNYCIDCGKEITYGSTRCVKCERKTRRQNNISREELKQLIRTQSFVNIGKSFNVSDNAIRKWCKSFNLPYKKTEIKQYTDEEWEKV